MSGILKIPESFLVKPFFTDRSTIILNDQCHFFAENSGQSLFYDDLLHNLNVKSAENIEPWFHPELSVRVLLERWNNIASPLLEGYYKERNRHKARPIMIQYTAYYIQAMHWVGGKPVTSLTNLVDQISTQSFAPVNIADRLLFIISSIDNYHAYVTLTQLFDESRKKWAIYLD